MKQERLDELVDEFAQRFWDGAARPDLRELIITVERETVERIAEMFDRDGLCQAALAARLILADGALS